MTVTSEQMREDLPKILKEMTETTEPKTYAFGGDAGCPHYQLASLDQKRKESIGRAVRITAEDACKGWSDVRAVIRLLKLTFIITVEGKECAVIQPHPQFRQSHARFAGWLAELTGQREHDVTRRFTHTLEERIAQLEGTVDDLEREVAYAIDLAEDCQA